MSRNSGVIRITGSDWKYLTQYAVNMTIKLARPINQATVLKAIMHEKMAHVDQKELIEMVKAYLDMDR